MLAKISEGVADALRQLRLDTAESDDVTGNGSSCLAEYKYDGQRAQIHLLADGTVRGRVGVRALLLACGRQAG